MAMFIWGDSVKNNADALFFTQQFVSERKQIAFITSEKLHSQVSRRIFATSRSEMGDNMKKKRVLLCILGIIIIAVVGLVVGIVCFRPDENKTNEKVTSKSESVEKPEYMLLENQVITGLSGEKYENVHKLQFKNCEIVSLAGLSKLSQLRELVIEECTVKDLAESETCHFLIKVSITNCNINNLEDFPAICNTNFNVEFNLSNNNITTLKGCKHFFGKSKVINLDLSSNKLQDVEGISEVPFEDDAKLSFQDNQIKDISKLDVNNYLASLNLSYNDISDFNPIRFAFYSELLITGNPILCYNPLQCVINQQEYWDESVATDFEFPTDELYFFLGDFWVCFDRAPVKIKGQDIFVSPTNFFEAYTYKCKTEGDVITLSRKNIKIVFKDKGRTMIYKGKTYRSPYPAYQKDGVTYIPANYFIEKLGGSIKRMKNTGDDICYEVKLPKSLIREEFMYDD